MSKEAQYNKIREELWNDEIFRYTVALDVFEQYKWNLYDKEIEYGAWLERAIKISEQEKIERVQSN